MILSDHLRYPFRIKRRNYELLPKFSYQLHCFRFASTSALGWMWVELQVRSPFQGRPPSDWWCPGQSPCAGRWSCWTKVCPSDRPSATEKTTQESVIVRTRKHVQSPSTLISLKVESRWQKPRARLPFNRREPGARPWKSILSVTHDLEFLFFIFFIKKNKHVPTSSKVHWI